MVNTNEVRERKIVSYLRNLGDVSFYEGDFSSLDSINYPSIELTTRDGLAEGLEAFVNSSLSKENGLRAYLRLIGLHDFGNGLIKYSGEIVPYEDVPFNEWEEATDEFLHRLPKAVKEFRFKNGCSKNGR